MDHLDEYLLKRNFLPNTKQTFKNWQKLFANLRNFWSHWVMLLSTCLLSFTIQKQDNTHNRGKYHCTAELLFETGLESTKQVNLLLLQNKKSSFPTKQEVSRTVKLSLKLAFSGKALDFKHGYLQCDVGMTKWFKICYAWGIIQRAFYKPKYQFCYWTTKRENT